MSDQEAFFRMIRDNPDDDTPRLVFADWLQEQGDDDRAEFIRVQCRLAQLKKQPSRDFDDWDQMRDLTQRERELLRDHETEWRSALPLDVSGAWRWGNLERGFIDEISVDDWAGFEPDIDAVIDSQPVARVYAAQVNERLSEGVPQIDRLLAQTRDLTVALLSGFDEQIKSLASYQPLNSLQSLRIRGSRTSRTCLNVLVRSHAFPHLRSLQLVHSRLDTSEPRQLLSTDHWTALTDLALADNQIDGRFFEQPDIHPLFQRLHHLDLSRNRIDGDSIQNLADASGPWPLKELVLNHNPLVDQGIRAISASSLFANLNSLDLSHTRVQAEGVDPLTQASFWPHLLSLSLSGNPIGSLGVRYLTEAPPPSNLTSLDLAQTNLEAADGELLAHWPGLVQLRSLDLRENPRFGDSGTIALIQSPYLTNLAALYLQDTGLTITGLKALLDSPILPQLRGLSLGGNPIDRQGVHHLVTSPKVANLFSLDLSRIALDQPTLQAILDSPYLNGLRYIAVSAALTGNEALIGLRNRFGPGALVS